MNEQVMIYEIKSSAASNATVLFSDDNQYFYWNEERFKNLTVGDYIFVVNKTDKWVLFTQLDKLTIPTTVQNNTTYFGDLNKNFTVSGNWNKFIRLKIINRFETPENWEWKSFGNSETTYLNGSHINIQKAENRIKNISQLKELTNDEKIIGILESCLTNFTGSGKILSSTLQQETLRNNSHMESLNILTAIKTKPFILLAGISGTGKSRLVRTLAYKTCSEEKLQNDPNKPGNFELIPVRPNWHDSSEMMGYVSRIKGEKYIVTTFLRFIVKAWQHTDVPFFLCLDEMNLAPVEQYFAEYLSVIETRQIHEGKIVSDYILSKASFGNDKLYKDLLNDLKINGDSRFDDGISIPENLVVIGTVNMDETTHSFSRKVLDRAMNFEMNHVDLYAGLDTSQNDWSYPREFIPRDRVIGTFTTGAEVITDFPDSKKVIDFLQKINDALEETPFKVAYRVRDEFLIYCYYASLNPTDADWLTNALDEMVCMKIVFRIEGDESRTGTAIDNLINHLSDTGYPKSLQKLNEMKKKLSFGYTSPWS